MRGVYFCNDSLVPIRMYCPEDSLYEIKDDFKNFRFGESKYIQVRADFFNAFNHPQYVPGSVNTVDPVGTTGLTTLNQIAPLTSDFLNPSKVLSSNPRVIQMALRFNF